MKNKKKNLYERKILVLQEKRKEIIFLSSWKKKKPKILFKICVQRIAPMKSNSGKPRNIHYVECSERGNVNEVSTIVKGDQKLADTVDRIRSSF